MIRVCFIASYGLQFSDGLEGDVVLQVDAPESCGTQFFEEELLLKYFTALFEWQTSLFLKSMFAGEEVIVFLVEFVKGISNFTHTLLLLECLFANVLHWVIF